VTKTAMMADLHLPVRPAFRPRARERAHSLGDRARPRRSDYIERYTTGFEALRESVREYTPERVAEITGLTPELVCRTAWTYARAEAAFIGWTMGVNHSTKGTETVNAINNLALITGNIGRTGAAPFSITGQCNAMGTREAGFASIMPGYRKFEDAGIARTGQAVERAGQRIPPSAVSRIRTSSKRRSKKIRTVDHATNPVVSFPNLRALQQALEVSSSSSCRLAITRRRPRIPF
jgi:assimilatory nitrate reductase catalytic subunit